MGAERDRTGPEGTRRDRKGSGTEGSKFLLVTGGGGRYSFVAGLSCLTIDHASLSRRSTGGGSATHRLMPSIFVANPSLSYQPCQWRYISGVSLEGSGLVHRVWVGSG